MNIFAFSIKRPVTITVIVLAVIIMGLMYGSRLNIEDFPKIDVPIISVSTIYAGAGPEEIEDQITIPIEEAVGSVGNIDELESTSEDNVSVVLVRFKYGTNMNVAAADIREKLDKIKKDFPKEAENPVTIKADPADAPVVRLVLTSRDNNLRRARNIAQNEIRKELEKIGGIAQVTVSGGEERAVAVQVDKNAMESRGIAVNQVAAAIARENANIPSGRITTKSLEFSVRSMGELKNVKDFDDILISMANGNPIFLKDIATIADDKKEVRKIARYNGQNCVSIEVRKNTDANTVIVADEIKKAIPDVNRTLPTGYELTLAYDNSKTIKEAIKNLKDNAIEGAILTILFVFVFLWSFRSTFVITLSLPISIIATFLLMYFNGMTINMLTILGFILAIGNIVDASIVVLENIYRHLEMGKDPVKASVDGAEEVGGAVLGGAMTTVLAFVPITLISGLSGQIFSALAKTFMFALLCSLATADFVVPMFCSRFMGGEVEGTKKPKGIMGKFSTAWNAFFDRVLSVYSKMLNWSLGHRGIVITISVAVLIVSLVLGIAVPKEFMGKWDRGDILINIEMPVGSSLERTDKVVTEVEKFVMDKTPEKDTVITDVGQGPSGARRFSAAGESPRLGGLTLSLLSSEERLKHKMRSTYQVQDMVTDEFKNYPGAKIQVAEAFSMTGKKPIEILIRGNDLEKLASIADGLKAKLAGVKGLKNLDISHRPGSPEYRIVVDRKKAAELGVGSSQVAGTLRMLLAQDEVSKFREEGNEYDIFVQLPEGQRDSIDKIRGIKFQLPSGGQVSLSELAKIIPAYSPAGISRRDRSRYVAVQADITGRASSDVLADILTVLKKEKMPTGVNWIIAGDEKRRAEVFGELFSALFLSIILVYVFLALQFESFIHPFTILLSVPLELAGFFGALLLSKLTMTIFALLGLIMLVGVVVAHAIVLIDYIIIRKKGGMSTMDAIREAAPLRLRPILMTVGAAVFAMVPLALGLRAGTDLFKPLAVGSIGGLLSSTFLTLLVIPVVYSLFEELGEKISSKKFKDRKVIS